MVRIWLDFLDIGPALRNDGLGGLIRRRRADIPWKSETNPRLTYKGRSRGLCSAYRGY